MKPTDVRMDTDPTKFLRNSLRANAIFSSLSGSAFAVANAAIASFLGDLPSMFVMAVGLQLLLFAGFLLWLASRSEIPVRLALGVIVADLLWVAGTVVVIYLDLLPGDAANAAMIVADVVLVMAILQSIGVYRLGAARVTARS